MLERIPRQGRMTVEEFLAWEARQRDDNIYELSDGRVVVKDGEPVKRDGRTVVMSAPSPTHAQIVTNLTLSFGRRLPTGGPCRPIAQARVPAASKAADGYYIPDVIVTCEPGSRGHSSPRLIAEVASPSTRDYDSGAKLEDYQQLDTLMEIMLPSSDKRRVRLWQRLDSRWIVQDFVGSAVVPLENLGIEVTLDEIYANTEL